MLAIKLEAKLNVPTNMDLVFFAIESVIHLIVFWGVFIKSGTFFSWYNDNILKLEKGTNIKGTIWKNYSLWNLDV